MPHDFTCADRRIGTLVLAIVLLAAACAGCAERVDEKGVFYTAGAWDIPPAFHGNPWAPGGSGVAGAYVYEPLFIYLPRSGKYVPRLGQSFSEKGLQVTVNLKKNVTWHDGEPFTAQDVLTTFNIGYLKRLGIWQDLKSVSCPGEHTVVFTWRRPSPTNIIRVLTERITSPRGLFGKWSDLAAPLIRKGLALPEDDLESFRELSTRQRDLLEVMYRHHPPFPVGTGPFTVSKVTASDMVLEKFPRYYEAQNVHIGRVRILRWSSNEVVWSYLMTGGTDAVTPACPYDVALQILKRNPQMHLITPSDMNEFGLIFNCRRMPVGSLTFRRALAHVINRDQVRQVAYYYGDTVDDYSLGVVRSFRRQWLPDSFYGTLTRYDYDPAKAEALMRERGFARNSKGLWLSPQGEIFSLEIIAPAGQNDMVLLAETSSSQLSKFGIPAKVRVLPMEIYSAFLRDGKFDLAASDGPQLAKYGHPSISFSRIYHAGGQIKCAAGLPDEMTGRDGTPLNTEKMSRRLELAVSPQERDHITAELAWITNENLPFLSCYEKNIMIFTQDGKRVTGWPSADDELWQASQGGVETVYATMIAKGIVKPAP